MWKYTVMAKTYEDDKKILTDLLDEWERDAVIDKAAPNETCADNSKLHAKYLKILARHSININESEQEYLDMRRLRTAFYEGTLTKAELDSQGWTQYLGKAPKVNAQRDQLLESDPFLMEIKKRQKVYAQIVDTCERILKEIHGREFMIPAFMNWEMRIRQG
jgi:hypothetical protein